MNKIVIVEDMLERGISLAEQFGDLAERHPEWEIRVEAVCFFNLNSEAADKKIRECGNQPFDIKRISTWNFEETMNDYTDPENEPAIVIIDFLLQKLVGTHMRRVNIRYARSVDDDRKKQLWFYTASGTENFEALCKLIGKEHVLKVKRIEADFLNLELEGDPRFVQMLEANCAVGV